MEYILAASIAVTAALLIVVIYLIKKSGEVNNNSGNPESLNLLLEQMNNLSRVVDEKISQSQNMVRESMSAQFDRSSELIRKINEQVSGHLINVTKGITEAAEASKQVFTIADSLKNLEKVLKNQKQRGSLGEASLELILSNILPPGSFELQYEFKNGEKVDAVILTKDGVIPIDAKFSLDNYERLIKEENEVQQEEIEKEFRNDLKKRIDETAKYIRPDEKTLPFAFMYIPAEGIYYDLLNNQIGSIKSSNRSLIDYAYTEKKVIIVSPTTFAAYLQSVLYGFRAFKIEESAQEIRKFVNELQRHLKAYEEYFSKLGNSLQTTVNHYNSAGKEFKKIDKDVFRITGKASAPELPEPDKPDLSEMI